VDVKSCMPVIPSADLEKSLRFWVEGLGLTMDRAMRQDGRLIGCMVHNEHLYYWLNQRAGTPVKPEDYEGVRLYWAPRDIHGLRARLERKVLPFNLALVYLGLGDHGRALDNLERALAADSQMMAWL
jgi:hypothetical protein